MTITLKLMVVQVVFMARTVVIIIITVIVMIILAVVVVVVDITTLTTTAVDIPLPKSVLVVVHPNFQHPFIHTHFTAKLLYQILISLLHLPSNSLRELQHLVLLELTELGPEPLPRARILITHRCNHRRRQINVGIRTHLIIVVDVVVRMRMEPGPRESKKHVRGGGVVG